MTITLVKDETADRKTGDLHAQMEALGARARKAAAVLAQAHADQKVKALHEAAAAIRRRTGEILAANRRDVEAAEAKGMAKAMVDRLLLTEARLEATAQGLETVAALPDPVGAVLDRRQRPNGMWIERVRVPLGVIGIIYESRPAVTADAAALCLKAGNACILRGGSESAHSSRVIADCMSDGLRAAGLPADAVQMVPVQDRAVVGILLTMDKYIDVIVPRGGQSLTERVMRESRVPVFAHLIGLCHTYVHAGANLEMARAIVLNAKMRRTSICGATETLLVDRAVADTHLPPILADLHAKGCEIRGDETVLRLDSRAVPAKPEDWDTEYLDAILAVRVVDNIDEAIAHINRHSSNHTDSIVTDDEAAAEKFLAEIDSGIVLHNASTQFADGGEFGMGAEIGISTGKMHARGPVGAEQLTSYKYLVRGSGQTRP
jgi:glutamate-5-semialdehyde dehydrogenase